MTARSTRMNVMIMFMLRLCRRNQRGGPQESTQRVMLMRRRGLTIAH